MSLPQSRARRAVGLAASSLLTLGLLAGVPAAAGAAPSSTSASGDGWAITPTPGGYLVELELDEPLPVVSDAPVLLLDGVPLGTATESDDGLSLSLVTTDPAVLDADTVSAGWSSGREKVEPTDAPVTAPQRAAVEPVAPSQARSADLLAEARDLADGGAPGTYDYVVDDYDFGDQAIPMEGIGLLPDSSGPLRSEMTGRVYLPTSGGARPTVVLLHGRHTSCSTLVTGTANPTRWPCVPGQTEVPSFKGYDALGETLATHGYAVVSISANAINANDAQQTLDNGAQARGRLVLDTLEMLEKAGAGQAVSYDDLATSRTVTLDQALDAPRADVAFDGEPAGLADPDTLDAADLVGRFDLTNVGLMGHSRGGEGVVSAVTLNQESATPFGITSVLPLAPVDFGRMTVRDTPMMVMLPYCDGDVSNQQGQHFIDDSRYAFDDSVLLSTVWAMGANHNFFNTVWTPGVYAYSVSDDWGATSTDAVCGPRAATNIRLSASQQYDVGTAVMAAWFRLTMGGESGFQSQFDGSQPKPVLSTVPSADLRVLGNAPAADRVDINRLTTTDTAITTTGTASVVACASAGGRTLQPAVPPCATANALRTTGAMPHWTPASYGPNVPASPMTELTWSSQSAAMVVPVPTAARDAAAYRTLVFKTAPEENVLTGTDLTVSVTDATGRTWSSLVSALNPLAVRRMPISGSTTLNKIVLQQVSVPVASMTGIDTSAIREVRFAAGRGADATDGGGVYLSDLALVRPSIGTAVQRVAEPTIAVEPTTVDEGTGPGSAQVAVTLSAPLDRPVTGYVSVLGSTTARAGVAMEPVTFAPGQTCRTLTVPLLGDRLSGTVASAAFRAAVTNPQGVITGRRAFALVSVREDDGTVGATADVPPPTPLPPSGTPGDACAEATARTSVQPATTSTPTTAPGGSTVVTATGFRPGEGVRFDDGSGTLGTVVADAAGTASYAVAVPASAATGDRTVTAVGAGSGRSAAATVAVRPTVATVPPTTTPPTTSPVALASSSTTLTTKVRRGAGKVVLKVRVSGSTATAPTGTVVIRTGKVTRTVVLSGSRARTTVPLAKARGKATATYGGDAAHTGGSDTARVKR